MCQANPPGPCLKVKSWTRQVSSSCRGTLYLAVPSLTSSPPHPSMAPDSYDSTTSKSEELQQGVYPTSQEEGEGGPGVECQREDTDWPWQGDEVDTTTSTSEPALETWVKYEVRWEGALGA